MFLKNISYLIDSLSYFPHLVFTVILPSGKIYILSKWTESVISYKYCTWISRVPYRFCLGPLYSSFACLFFFTVTSIKRWWEILSEWPFVNILSFLTDNALYILEFPMYDIFFNVSSDRYRSKNVNVVCSAQESILSCSWEKEKRK